MDTMLASDWALAEFLSGSVVQPLAGLELLVVLHLLEGMAYLR